MIMANFAAEWHENEHGSGFVLVRPDGQRLSWERLDFAEDGLWSFEVVGEQFYPGVSASAEFTPGCEVRLQPEPDNPYDPNAIAVVGKGGAKAGHVPANIAPGVLQCLSGCTTYVMWRHHKNPGRADVRLLMAKNNIALRLDAPLSSELKVVAYPRRGIRGIVTGLLFVVALAIILRTCA
jgi:hypothetical protein